MERLVSRADLHSRSASPQSSPDPDNIPQLLPSLGEFEVVHYDAANQSIAEADEELEFQLFAPATSSTAKDAVTHVQKIKLRSPSPSSATGEFAIKHRDLRFHLREPLSAEQIQGYRAVAVSGDEVIQMSARPHPGDHYAWRVLHLDSTGLSREIRRESSNPFSKLLTAHDPKQRTKPGKKARIKARTKLQLVAKQAEERQAVSIAKEAAEREKRTQRNREKKLKRRDRERAKKAELRANGADVDESMDDSDGDGGHEAD